MSLGSFLDDAFGSSVKLSKKGKFTPAPVKKMPVNVTIPQNDRQRLVSSPRNVIQPKKSVILTGIDSYNN